jgi:hypothetical protein
MSQQSPSAASRPLSSAPSTPSALRETSDPGSRIHQEDRSANSRLDFSSAAASAEPLSPVSAQSVKSTASSPTAAKAPTIAQSSSSRRYVKTTKQVEEGSAHKEKLPLNTKDGTDKQKNNIAERDEPILPMTPKSPRARSPPCTSTALTIATLPTNNERTQRTSLESISLRTSTIKSEDRTVVDELLDTMKQMLGTLGATFDTLGEQTMKVATLPAAMDAVHQVSPAIAHLQVHVFQIMQSPMVCC